MIKNTEQSHIAFISMLEPKNFNEASKDDHWVKAMNDELDQIEKNNTWKMVLLRTKHQYSMEKPQEKYSTP
jgi:hypothetical protein